jgi:hypothetical protein
MAVIGYFSILPADLRIELSKYYIEQFELEVILETESQMYDIKYEKENHKKRKYLSPLPQDTVHFDISIFTVANRSPIVVPYEAKFGVLKAFLEFDVMNSRFKYLTMDHIKPLKEVKRNNERSTQLHDLGYIEAQSGKLHNHTPQVFLVLEKIGDTLQLSFDSSEMSYPLYELDQLQSEILIHKLIEFYNDLVQITETQINIKRQY